MMLKCSILLNVGFVLGSSQIYFPNEQLDQILRGNNTSALGSRIDLSPGVSKAKVDVDSLVARSVTKLTLDINRVAPSSIQLSNSNLVFAPISIVGVMALVLLASIGQTFDEIANFMGLNTGFNIQNDILEVHQQLGRVSGKVKLHTGLHEMIQYKMGIFVQEDYPIRPEYRQAATYFYQSDIISLNFKTNAALAQQNINNWVSQNTNGKITSLLDTYPDSQTKAIIASVLYFKGVWAQPFFKGASNLKPFFVNGRKSRSDRNVTMMYNGGEFPYYKDKHLDVEILGLPYKGKRSTMYVILPNESNVQNLRQLENYLTPADIERLVASTQITEAAVAFPRMKIANTLDLASTIQNLGVRSAFSPYVANLALMTPGVRQRFADVPPSYQTTQRPQRFADAPAPYQTTTTTQRPQRFADAPAPYQTTTTTQRPQRFADAPAPYHTTTTTQRPHGDLANQLIFARFGQQSNCEQVYDIYTNRLRCRNDTHSRYTRANENFLDILRNAHRQFKLNPDQVNPGLYADQFVHKVFVDVTEDGTEAAAASGLGLNRSGSKVTFRCDVPFLFFIYQEDTKMILFWGSIVSPTPSVTTNNRSK